MANEIINVDPGSWCAFAQVSNGYIRADMGMTKRELIAMQLLGNILTATHSLDSQIKLVLEATDALLKALNDNE